MKRCTFMMVLVGMLFAGAWRPTQAQDFSCGPINALCWPRLKRDARGRNVKVLQQLLQIRGYKTVADGRFGYGTETVVRKFQKTHRLQQDGTVGWQTWEALVPTLHKGSRGATVRLLQTMLNTYGQGVPHVGVDGVYGAATQHAVHQLGELTFSEQPINIMVADARSWCPLVGGHYYGD